MSDDTGFDDLDDLMGMFFEEGREYIESLNISLMAMEESHDDTHAVNEAFRAAHSLKGMAGTMGFERTVKVTHELETVLDQLRANPSMITHDVITIMLSACDQLGVLLAELEQSNTETADTTAVVAALHAWTASEGSVVMDVPDSAPDAGASMSASGLAPGEHLYEVDIMISPRSGMPGVRMFGALAALESIGEVGEMHPERAVVEAAEHELRQLTLRLKTTSTAEAVEVQAMAREITEVHVTLVESGVDAAAAPAVGVQQVVKAAAAPSSEPTVTKARSVRVAADRLDDLMHGVEELLVRRARVQSLVSHLNQHDLAEAVDALDRAARDLQDLVMDVRMVSVNSVMRILPRMVRDLADELGKEVEITLTGRDTELDRTVVEVLSDPLMHLIRNSVDHGLEFPDVREAAGKPRTGHIEVSARTEGGAVLIQVQDDGKGFDPDRIRARSIERGLLTEEQAHAMDDDQILDMCFVAGFSTREEANRISGRGVGLDIVRASIRSLGGDVSAQSLPVGTLMTIRLPLTLAIRSVLNVRVADEVYCFHTDRVGLTLDLALHPAHEVLGETALSHMGSVVPLVDLGDMIGVSKQHESRYAVLIESASGIIGVKVDEVLGQQEVVTRALPSSVHTSHLLSSSAVLGNGDVAFLIDAELIGAQNSEGHGAHTIYG